MATSAYGIVVITDVTGEVVDPNPIAEFYPGAGYEQIWATWRTPTLDELIHTWPAKAAAGEDERKRGWWQPAIEELREARRTARSRERRRAR